MELAPEQQEQMREKLKTFFPDHPQPEVEFYGNDHSILEDPSPLLRLTAGLTAVPSTRIKSICSTRFHAVHQSGHRSAVFGETIHCTQSTSALSAAAWFENIASSGSAQRCVDNLVCYRTLPDNIIPWAAPGMNLYHNHLEFAGYDSWSNQEWLENHKRELNRGAYKIAVDAKTHKFPIKWLTVDDLRNGEKKGVTDHWAVSHAFGLSSHHDPRNSWTSDEWGYPHFWILDRARYHLKRL